MPSDWLIVKKDPFQICISEFPYVNSLTRTATFTVMAHTSQFPLPVELLVEVVKNLPLADQQSFSFTSRLNREVALPFIFAHLQYTEPITPKIRKIQQADKKIKGAIKSVLSHVNQAAPNHTILRQETRTAVQL